MVNKEKDLLHLSKINGECHLVSVSKKRKQKTVSNKL